MTTEGIRDVLSAWLMSLIKSQQQREGRRQAGQHAMPDSEDSGCDLDCELKGYQKRYRQLTVSQLSLVLARRSTTFDLSINPKKMARTRST